MELVDSCVFIGAFNPRDGEHKRGAAIVKAIDERKFKAAITDYILNEILTFVRKKSGYENSLVVLEILESHPNINLIRVDNESYNDAFDIFRKYPALSFTDSASVSMMMNHKIKNIYSFDGGFDGIKEVNRKSCV